MDDMPTIDAALAGRLIAEQFPQWADLPILPVALGGWDNRTFHLGERMTVRLPSAARYAAQVEKEQRWLPRLARDLPLPIPAPLAMGRPGQGYPWRWSVYGWLDGETAAGARIDDRPRFAADLGAFLSALQRIEATDGPPAGPHSFWRGGPLSTYDAETRTAIAALDGRIDARAVTAVWEAALETCWAAAPVWVHGDMAAGNLLVLDGDLSAVIDFGCSCVGDPACDLRRRLDLPRGRGPRGLPRSPAPRRRNLGARPRLDPVESADRLCWPRLQSPQRREIRADHRRPGCRARTRRLRRGQARH
jgi:aminoglycoside phosphotransferase (APT) family kinase protein